MSAWLMAKGFISWKVMITKVICDLLILRYMLTKGYWLTWSSGWCAWSSLPLAFPHQLSSYVSSEGPDRSTNLLKDNILLV
jgi:hypothetical protein